MCAIREDGETGQLLRSRINKTDVFYGKSGEKVEAFSLEGCCTVAEEAPEASHLPLGRVAEALGPGHSGLCREGQDGVCNLHESFQN